MYSLLLALIYIAFISLGLPDSLLGSGWPVIHNDLNVPISFMGVVSMVISGGTIVSSLFSDKLTRKLGARIVTVSSVFLTAVALFGFSFSDRFWMLIVFAVPYGLGAGARRRVPARTGAARLQGLSVPRKFADARGVEL